MVFWQSFAVRDIEVWNQNRVLIRNPRTQAILKRVSLNTRFSESARRLENAPEGQ